MFSIVEVWGRKASNLPSAPIDFTSKVPGCSSRPQIGAAPHSSGQALYTCCVGTVMPHQIQNTLFEACFSRFCAAECRPETTSSPLVATCYDRRALRRFLPSGGVRVTRVAGVRALLWPVIRMRQAQHRPFWSGQVGSRVPRPAHRHQSRSRHFPASGLEGE